MFSSWHYANNQMFLVLRNKVEKLKNSKKGGEKRFLQLCDQASVVILPILRNFKEI
jgi:hypothetical protein